MNHRSNNWMKIRQLEELIEPYRAVTGLAQPRSGWLRAVRDALGMNVRQLAARLGVSHTSVAKAEKSEANRTITLATLMEMAQALDCELVYALVPSKPLRDVVENRAAEVARKQLEQSGYHMALEDQQVSEEKMQRQIEQRQLSLLDGRWSKLWE